MNAPNAGVPRRRRFDAAAREHERAREDLGDRGVTVGDLYAYAWDARGARYNVVRLYARNDARVTRWMIAENPDGARERERPRWTDNVAQPARRVRTYTYDDVTGVYVTSGVGASVRGFRAFPTATRDIAWRRAPQGSAPRIVRVAPGNPDADARKRTPHVCPRTPRDRTEYAPRVIAGDSMAAACTVPHATPTLARACADSIAWRRAYVRAWREFHGTRP